MVDSQAFEIDLDQETSLIEIMHLVEGDLGLAPEGWNRETARLFAIDTAMAAIRRNITLLTESERHRLITHLQEARSLVVTGRDSELGFIQAAMETHLPLTANDTTRQIWLTAIDALLPSPYRAALVSTKSALSLRTGDSAADLPNLLWERLAARLGEGSIHSEPTASLFLTA